MGAWGIGSFENDSALDWLANAFRPGGAAAVEAALRYAAETPEDAYLEVDEASAVVAAAELVAAARDGDCPGWVLHGMILSRTGARWPIPALCLSPDWRWIAFSAIRSCGICGRKARTKAG